MLWQEYELQRSLASRNEGEQSDSLCRSLVVFLHDVDIHPCNDSNSTNEHRFVKLAYGEQERDYYPAIYSTHQSWLNTQRIVGSQCN